MKAKNFLEKLKIVNFHHLQNMLLKSININLDYCLANEYSLSQLNYFVFFIHLEIMMQ